MDVTEIFADGANIATILSLAADKRIRGFTTNPELMRKSGLTSYPVFAKAILKGITDRPVSFEVLADDTKTMRSQAETIHSWAPNVYVKIPITTTNGDLTTNLVAELSDSGIHVNVTAVTTVDQVERAAVALSTGAPSFISVFAGRIADTGVDPCQIIAEAVEIANAAGTRIIWASPREVLNVVQAHQAQCHAITLTSELIAKLPLLGKDLGQVSLDTVRMFHNAANVAGYEL